MEKPIARRYCSVGPLRYLPCAQKLLPPCQPFTTLLDFLYWLLEPGRDRGGREFHPRYAPRLQHPLFLWADPLELLLDKVPEVSGHLALRDLPRQLPSPLPLDKHGPRDQLIHHL